MPSDPTPTEARPCSCGDRRRAGINHRITIPCWAYIGTQRVEINSAGTVARETMTTYRPANPAEFVTEWTWQTTLDWAHDAAEWEPVEVIEERWELVERKTYTVRDPCSEVDCNADATHWGLCEAHAREDDPTAFDDSPECIGPEGTCRGSHVAPCPLTDPEAAP